MEPAEAYRPLVRDRRSQALIQAWPALDMDRKGETVADLGLPPGAHIWGLGQSVPIPKTLKP